MKKLTGLCAAAFTPYNAQGMINYDQIQPLADLYSRNGIDGVFIAGTTGEGPSLAHQEKIDLLKAWAKADTGTLQVIFMLGGTCLSEMLELAKISAAYNLDGISILCPYYFRPKSEEDLVSFCADIAISAPDLAFYYYHIPSLTGGNYSMSAFLQLASKRIPNFAGIKYTAADLFEFQQCCAVSENKYAMLWGTDEALLSGLVAGASGAVGSTYNYAAPLYLEIIQAFNAGDLAKARINQQKAVEMVSLLIKYGGIGAGKLFMHLVGLDCGEFRSPISPPSPADVSALANDLKEIGFFDFCNQI